MSTAVLRGDEPALADVYTGYSRITAFYDEIVDHLAEPGR